LSILLGRWLGAEAYGAYALAFSIYLLLLGAYQAVILEPIGVMGPYFYQGRFRQYLGSLIRVHAIFAIPAICLLAGAAEATLRMSHSVPLASALAGLAVAAPFTLLLTLSRCACYIQNNPTPALQGALLYLVSLAAGLAIVTYAHALSPFTVFAIIGAGSLAGSWLILARLQPVVGVSQGRPPIWEVWRQHWQFGQWDLSKMFFDWLMENITYASTGAVLGLREVGGLKALMTLFLPFAQVITAMRRLILPDMVGQSRGNDRSGTLRYTKKVLVIFVAAGFIYGGFLVAVGRPLFRFLYVGKFMDFVPLLPLVSLTLIFGVPAHALDLGIRAMRAPRYVFFASGSAAVATTVVMVPMTQIWGVRGTLIAYVLGSLFASISAIVFFRKCASNAAPEAYGCAESEFSVMLNKSD
jgi:O-antigen/teichoic acid export membrane protein